jgi:AraC-like DNA-binding protein
VRDGRFSKALFVELDLLSVTVPPLRQRLADIEPLVASILDRHGYRVELKRTDALIDICKSYAWPENLFELERVIARLAVMTDAEPICPADILRHTPWVTGKPPSIPTAETTSDAATEIPDDEAALHVPEHWVRCAINKDMAELAKLHESVRKALLHLGEHYAEPISLGQLAQKAHVSPSHLTFLFRSELGTAFKPFLLRIRVHKAKEMMTADPRMRITEVAMSVGFTDLSHFEKTFRKIAGRSAREFRRGILDG